MAKTLKTRPRSLRVRDDDSTDEPYSDELEGSSPSIMIDGEDVSSASEEDEVPSGNESDASVNSEDDDDDDDDSQVDSASDADDGVQARLNKVAFGDLAKAQSNIAQDTASHRKRKRGAESSAETEAKLQALRERLRELREAKGVNTYQAAAGKPISHAHPDGDEATSGSDSDDSDAPEAVTAKRSKHAPMAAPSNKAVSRKRTVISSTKPASARARDPRFAPLSGPAPSTEQLAKNYAFLDDYRKSEIADLKDKLGEKGKGKKAKQQQPKKKSKLSEEDEARLKKELARMESQEQSRREKHRLEDIARTHKRQEKEKIAEGKNPYFLKKSEQKRLALVDKFEGMRSKQRDKALDRKRKKIAQKERRSMPAARRGTVG